MLSTTQTIDPKTLLERDTNKDNNVDFKKFLIYPYVLIQYVTKNKINKKIYFDTIKMLKSRMNHCAMISFHNCVTFGLYPLNNFFKSNFSRFNGVISKICYTLRNVKILKQCLIQQIKQIDTTTWEKVLKLHLANTNWCKWKDRKWCMIGVASGSRTFPECTNHPKIDQGQLIQSFRV